MPSHLKLSADQKVFVHLFKVFVNRKTLKGSVSGFCSHHIRERCSSLHMWSKTVVRAPSNSHRSYFRNPEDTYLSIWRHCPHLQVSDTVAKHPKAVETLFRSVMKYVNCQSSIVNCQLSIKPEDWNASHSFGSLPHRSLHKLDIKVQMDS